MDTNETPTRFLLTTKTAVHVENWHVPGRQLCNPHTRAAHTVTGPVPVAELADHLTCKMCAKRVARSGHKWT